MSEEDTPSLKQQYQEEKTLVNISLLTTLGPLPKIHKNIANCDPFYSPSPDPSRICTSKPIPCPRPPGEDQRKL